MIIFPYLRFGVEKSNNLQRAIALQTQLRFILRLDTLWTRCILVLTFIHSFIILLLLYV